MANAKCRSCDHDAVGAYCSSCAAHIMAKALNSFFVGRRKKFLWRESLGHFNPSTKHLLFQ